MLYLSDGGAMSFVDASSKRRVRDVSVVPGRLVVWDNVSLLHEVCVVIFFIWIRLHYLGGSLGLDLVFACVPGHTRETIYAC